MQVMFDQGIEHGIASEGLGQWPGTVEKLDSEKLPNIGWNRLEVGSGSRLFAGVEEEYFYFVHSYAAKRLELDVMPPFKEPVLSYSEHGEKFLAAVENGPLMATQFHPEKSGEAGLQLLENWLGTI
jgi:imidazole glycerol phosphate synthase, glutamine amidotransferase subunit